MSHLLSPIADGVAVGSAGSDATSAIAGLDLSAEARQLARHALQRSLIEGTEPHLTGLSYAGELLATLRSATSAVPPELDDEWVDALTVSGTFPSAVTKSLVLRWTMHVE